AADLAEGLRRIGEIEVRERVGKVGLRRQVVGPEERRSGEVRWPPDRFADADIRARLAEIRRQELRVTVRKMQQADIAERRQVVEQALRARRRGVQRQAARGSGTQGMEEFPAVHAE